MSSARSTACDCESAEAAKLSAATGRGRRLLPLGDLLRPGAGQHDADLEALAVLQRLEQPSQRLGLARRPGPDDRRPRALAQRREPLDRLERRVLGAQRQPLAGPGHGEVLVAGAVRDGVGGRAVDRVDPDQRRIALRAAGRADGPGDAVARDELAAAHLRGGDVDVLVGGLGRVDAQERRSVAQHVDDALGDALLPLGVLGGGAGSALSPLAASSATATARARATLLGVLLDLGLLLRFGVGLLGLLGVLFAPAQAGGAAFAGPGSRRRLALAALVARRGLAGGLAQDRVDQVRLAQAPEAVEADLVCDRVEIGQRARLQLGAVEYSHGVFPLFSWMGGWRPAALVSGRHP